jgi:catechol 2,3-dioxygenase-like lactoylglutathione lyase family enzyme
MPNAASIANQIRVARPTDQLEAVVRFYRDGLGLEQVAGFENANRYDGAMLGLPGTDFHLEFTSHADGSPCPAPTPDNLLVFYLGDTDARDTVADQLRAVDSPEVPSDNPYWDTVDAVTFEDPDGWRVVLVPDAGL